MAFSFKDVLSHIEQTLIDSIKELKKNKKSIQPETAFYLFGLSFSSFIEDNISTISMRDTKVQARLLDSFRLGWKDAIIDSKKNMPDPQAQAQTPMETPVENQQAPGQGNMQIPGGAPAGPDQLGNLPMPAGASNPVPPSTQGGTLPNEQNPEEETPDNIKKPGQTTEKLDFRAIRQGFLNEGKFNGTSLKI